MLYDALPPSNDLTKDSGYISCLWKAEISLIYVTDLDLRAGLQRLDCPFCPGCIEEAMDKRD